jgi:Ca-activated chloride channel family protein
MLFRVGCVIVILIGAASFLAQDAPFTLKVDVSTVSLDVSVFNPAGIPVTDLEKQDFAVYEDGRRQEIQNFASSSNPYNILLIVDRSGSMRSQFPFLIQALNRFMANLRSQDRFALAAFDKSVRKLIDWRSIRTGSPKTVELGTGGDTDFYDALNWAAKELGKVRGRKAVLVFSDGEDYRIYDSLLDAKAFRKARQSVRDTRVPFHFVGLGTDPQRGGARIKDIAELSGGHAYFPENIEEVIPLYDRISRELGIAYTLGYSSDKPQRDGTYRRVEIVIAGTGYRVSQSRTGYYAN